MDSECSHTAILLTACLIVFVAVPASAEDGGKSIRRHLTPSVTIELGPARVVATSPPGERRWGRYQFPSLMRDPKHRILLSFHVGEDAVRAYGRKGHPTYVSVDDGRTWRPLAKRDNLPRGRMFPVFNGEFLCIASAVPLDTRKANIALPKPVGHFVAYVRNAYFRVDQCPKKVRDYIGHLDARRWSPKTRRWQKDAVAYDTRNALVWTRQQGEERFLIPRTLIEYSPLRIGDELIYADYRQNYLNPDGTVPRQRAVSCMVSKDNGKSFQYRTTITVDDTGTHLSGEPMLAQSTNGDLVCVVRRSDHRLKSMAVTFSKDRGHTWEKPTDLKTLGNFGVFPRLLTLECGVMLLSYGRPGVRLSVSPDGTGRKWTEPVVLIKGNHRRAQRESCGYTGLLSLDARSFLMVYSDFRYQDREGKTRKAIKVRKGTIRMQPGR